MPLTAMPLPPYMTGKHLSTFAYRTGVATPSTLVGSSPAITWSADTDLASIGTFKSWEYSSNWDQTDIKPAHYIVKNNVNMELGWTLDATDIRTHVGYSALLDGFGAAGYCRALTQNVNGAVSGYVFCVVGAHQGVKMNQSSGEHNATLNITSAGVAAYWGTSGGLTI